MSPENLVQEKPNPRNTVIKCKICQNIFYQSHAASHSCFIGCTKKKKPLDLTKHCSVDDCRYGLNCRIHSLEEKRKVKRPYSFDMLCKNNVEKKKKVFVCELDDEVIRIVNGIQPVVNKIWHWPRYKYEIFGMKNVFSSVMQKKRERK